MVISCPGSEWIIRLGPIERTNHAGSRIQAKEGALRQVLDDAKEIMEGARPLIPLLQKGAVCTNGCGEPALREEGPDPQVVCYELPDGKWFAIAASQAFGVKLECKKKGEE
ncbi:MAG: hypothetical protein HYU64_18000 [Armatimonadetes bacterium]|nr:hypothetical protein [Armatimonadota bacterium]